MTEDGNTSELGERWTAEELMGKGTPRNAAKTTPENKRKASFRRAKQVENGKAEPADWGRPGYLTQEEVDVYVSSVLTGESVARLSLWCRIPASRAV